MGAEDLDPFAQDALQALQPLHSLESLQEMAELLQMVHYWRTEAERLAHDYAWLEGKNRRRHEAKKAK